jgi:hypothetical protein
MQHHPLRLAAQIGSFVVVAAIFLGLAAAPARAAADANPVVIRYQNDRGLVPCFELAAALRFVKDKGIRIQSEGDSAGGPQVGPEWNFHSSNVAVLP